MLITLLIILVVAGFALWAIRLLPLDATIQTLIRGIIILAVVVYAIMTVVKFAKINV